MQRELMDERLPIDQRLQARTSRHPSRTCTLTLTRQARTSRTPTPAATVLSYKPDTRHPTPCRACARTDLAGGPSAGRLLPRAHRAALPLRPLRACSNLRSHSIPHLVPFSVHPVSPHANLRSPTHAIRTAMDGWVSSRAVVRPRPRPQPHAHNPTPTPAAAHTYALPHANHTGRQHPATADRAHHTRPDETVRVASACW
jgi:hypothetical protein